MAAICKHIPHLQLKAKSKGFEILQTSIRTLHMYAIKQWHHDGQSMFDIFKCFKNGNVPLNPGNCPASCHPEICSIDMFLPKPAH